MSRFLVFLACLVALVFCRCTQPSRVASPASPLYGPHDRELFDDMVELNVLGAPMHYSGVDGSALLLRERTWAAECTLSARLVTATSQQMGGGSSLRLELKVLETLRGACTSGGDLSLDLRPRAAARMYAPTVGTTMVAFVRSFAAGDGRTDLHFHLMAGGPAELRSVREAALLASVH